MVIQLTKHLMNRRHLIKKEWVILRKDIQFL